MDEKQKTVKNSQKIVETKYLNDVDSEKIFECNEEKEEEKKIMKNDVFDHIFNQIIQCTDDRADINDDEDTKGSTCTLKSFKMTDNDSDSTHIYGNDNKMLRKHVNSPVFNEKTPLSFHSKKSLHKKNDFASKSIKIDSREKIEEETAVSSDSCDDIDTKLIIKEVLCCYGIEYFKIRGRKFCLKCSAFIRNDSSRDFLRIYVEGHHTYFLNPYSADSKIFDNMKCFSCSRTIGKIVRQNSMHAYDECNNCRNAILRAEASGRFRIITKRN